MIRDAIGYLIIAATLGVWWQITRSIWRSNGRSAVGQGWRSQAFRAWLVMEVVSSAALFLAVGSVTRTYFFNPLPRDEELIAHFKAHREQFEFLVRAYYSAPEPQPGQHRVLWDKTEEIQQMKAAVGWDWVTNHRGFWPRDPYSPDAYARIMGIDQTTAEGKFASRQQEGLEIVIFKDRTESLALRFPGDAMISKALFHVPVPVRVSNGMIELPWEPGEPKPNYGVWPMRVLDSLNGYPSGWEKGRCLYRQIDPQWLLMMCRAS
ncbi:hypothetical protein [Niveibacterium sp. COAC-50]|uniref:hypothetical protein n=1 Tax=Niveibacterium sp. COAC-50 TaxID=2729384 RepID=UPI00155818AE|nr:hypothetical protein [Niveibacterium sp. COAC-50]